MTNTAIWKSLSVTDPKYTKKVNVGGGFTSINAQWQILQMTEQFGPVGQGWGYKVAHSIERITEDYVLAVADVTIWWVRENEAGRYEYGPVRGMSPIIEKSKSGYIMRDDDAGKKAATDALTKGLSHLGLSADVFLGLYDDNKYVREASKHFAEQHDNDGPGSSWGKDGKDGAIAEAERDGLRANAPEQKPEAVKRAKDRADKDIAAIRMSGHTTESLRSFWDGNAKAYDAMAKAVPEQFNRIEAAYLDALDAASARAA